MDGYAGSRAGCHWNGNPTIGAALETIASYAAPVINAGLPTRTAIPPQNESKKSCSIIFLTDIDNADRTLSIVTLSIHPDLHIDTLLEFINMTDDAHTSA